MISLDPSELFVNLVVSSVGLGLFMYGRKAERGPQIVAGLLLMVYPYFASGLTQLVTAGAVIVTGLITAIWLGW